MSIIFKKRAIPVPAPVGKVSLFVDLADGLVKIIDEHGTVSIVASAETIDAETARAIGIENTKADDSAVVHNTGTESVAGTKTFTSAPVVPDNSFTEAKVAGLVSDLASKETPAGAQAKADAAAGASIPLAGHIADSIPVAAGGTNIVDMVVAPSRLIGRASSGSVIPLTATQAKTILNITSTDISGLGTAATQNKVAAGTPGVLDATDATTANARTPIDNSVTDAKVATGAAIAPTKIAGTALIATQAGTANGIATLDSSGKITAAQVPSIAITDVFVVNSQVAMLALAAQQGDVAVRTDFSPPVAYILTADDPTILANWKSLNPATTVTSINGQTGSVIIPVDPISGTGGLRTLGTGAQQAAGGADLAAEITRASTAEGLKVAKSGDTMTGPLALSGDATLALQAVTKQQMDSGDVATFSASQPINSNLTAIAALTTTPFGRAVLALADAAALRTASGLGTSAVANKVAAGVTGVLDATDPTTTDARTPTDSSVTDAKIATTLSASKITGTALVATQAGTANGIATLDSSGKLTSAQVPAIAITDTFVVGSQATMLALTGQRGDVAIRTDFTPNLAYILTTDDPTQLVNWQALNPATTVTAINGQTGSVTIPVDPAPNTAGLRTLGTGAQQAAVGADLATEITSRGGADAAHVIASSAHAATKVSISTSGLAVVTHADVQAAVGDLDGQFVIDHMGQVVVNVDRTGGTDVSAGLAAADAIGAPLILPRGIYKVSADVTLSSRWWIVPGAIIKPDLGVTVTFAGELSAGAYQIFDLSATHVSSPTVWATCRLTGQSPVVHLEWWGVVGDWQQAPDAVFATSDSTGKTVTSVSSRFATTDAAKGVGFTLASPTMSWNLTTAISTVVNAGQIVLLSGGGQSFSGATLTVTDPTGTVSPVTVTDAAIDLTGDPTGKTMTSPTNGFATAGANFYLNMRLVLNNGGIINFWTTIASVTNAGSVQLTGGWPNVAALTGLIVQWWTPNSFAFAHLLRSIHRASNPVVECQGKTYVFEGSVFGAWSQNFVHLSGGDAVITAGSPYVTSLTAEFTQDDVNRYIVDSGTSINPGSKIIAVFETTNQIQMDQPALTNSSGTLIPRVMVSLSGITFRGIRGRTWWKHPTGLPAATLPLSRLNGTRNITFDGIGWDGNWGNTLTSTVQGRANPTIIDGRQSGINHTRVVDPKNSLVLLRGDTNSHFHGCMWRQAYGDWMEFFALANTLPASGSVYQSYGAVIENGRGDVSARDGFVFGAACEHVTIRGGEYSNHIVQAIDFEPTTNTQPINDVLIDGVKWFGWWNQSNQYRNSNGAFSVQGSADTAPGPDNYARNVRVHGCEIHGPVIISDTFDLDFQSNEIILDFGGPGTADEALKTFGAVTGRIKNNTIYDRAIRGASHPATVNLATTGALQAGNSAGNQMFTGDLEFSDNRIYGRNGNAALWLDGPGGGPGDTGTATAVTAPTVPTGSGSITTSSSTLPVTSTAGYPATGTIRVRTTSSATPITVTYTGTTGSSFTGCTVTSGTVAYTTASVVGDYLVVDSAKTWGPGSWLGRQVVMGGAQGTVSDNSASTLTVIGWRLGWSSTAVTTPTAGAYTISAYSPLIVIDNNLIDCTNDGAGQGAEGITVNVSKGYGRVAITRNRMRNVNGAGVHFKFPVTAGTTTVASPGVTHGTNQIPTIASVPIGRTITVGSGGTAETFIVVGQSTSGGNVSYINGLFANDHAGPIARTVTDGVTNSTTTVTSATAAFNNPLDIGATITGAGIPAGAKISIVNSTTSVTISAAATATASGVTLTITPPGETIAFSSPLRFLRLENNHAIDDGAGLCTSTIKFDQAGTNYLTQLVMSGNTAGETVPAIVTGLTSGFWRTGGDIVPTYAGYGDPNTSLIPGVTGALYQQINGTANATVWRYEPGAWVAISSPPLVILQLRVDTFGPGTTTVTKPSWAKTCLASVLPASGGGGSGARGTGVALSGGGSGGGSGFSDVILDATLLPSTAINVTVGTGGAGGAAQTTDSTAGVAGSAGGATYFGATAGTAYASGGGGGAGGGGGLAAAGTAGTAGTGKIAGAAGVAGSATGAAGTNGPAGAAGPGGGSGGGITAGGTASAGGGGRTSLVRGNATGATGGTLGGGTGGSGTNVLGITTPMPGGSGAGGGSSVTGAGGAGGAGALGAGGGGGGASLNGNASGAGGAGGDGMIQLIWTG